MHRSDVQFRLEFSGRWHIGSGTGRGLIDNAVRLKSDLAGWKVYPFTCPSWFDH